MHKNTIESFTRLLSTIDEKLVEMEGGWKLSREENVTRGEEIHYLLDLIKQDDLCEEDQQAVDAIARRHNHNGAGEGDIDAAEEDFRLAAMEQRAERHIF